MGGERRWLLVLACVLACAQGTSDTSRGSAEIGEGSATSTDGETSSGSESTSATTSSPMNCVPGQQVACACPGGADGAQACLPDGSGYAACECPGDDSGEVTGPTTESTGVLDTSSGESGNEGCPDECTSCMLCATQNDCAMEYAACNADEVCQGIVECAINCGGGTDCIDGCETMMAGMKSSALFQQLRACVEAVCPSCGGMGP
ncbi:MAG TPA: hypothetical protein VG755_17180 [Nannocystaceae bacterium]|nr:hypothetical protein [Nannocystaceae bacterium]